MTCATPGRCVARCSPSSRQRPRRPSVARIESVPRRAGRATRTTGRPVGGEVPVDERVADRPPQQHEPVDAVGEVADRRLGVGPAAGGQHEHACGPAATPPPRSPGAPRRSTARTGPGTRSRWPRDDAGPARCPRGSAGSRARRPRRARARGSSRPPERSRAAPATRSRCRRRPVLERRRRSSPGSGSARAAVVCRFIGSAFTVTSVTPSGRPRNRKRFLCVGPGPPPEGSSHGPRVGRSTTTTRASRATRAIDPPVLHPELAVGRHEPRLSTESALDGPPGRPHRQHNRARGQDGRGDGREPHRERERGATEAPVHRPGRRVWPGALARSATTTAPSHSRGVPPVTRGAHHPAGTGRSVADPGGGVVRGPLTATGVGHRVDTEPGGPRAQNADDEPPRRRRAARRCPPGEPRAARSDGGDSAHKRSPLDRDDRETDCPAPDDTPVPADRDRPDRLAGHRHRQGARRSRPSPGRPAPRRRRTRTRQPGADHSASRRSRLARPGRRGPRPPPRGRRSRPAQAAGWDRAGWRAPSVYGTNDAAATCRRATRTRSSRSAPRGPDGDQRGNARTRRAAPLSTCAGPPRVRDARGGVFPRAG